MKALTLHQPYASLVAIGVKTIETRSRATHHRGLLAIHAGMSQQAIGIDFWEFHERTTAIAIYSALGEAGYDSRPYHSPDVGKQGLPLGVIVAVVDLTACLPIVEEETEHPLPALVIEDGGSQLTESWHAPHPVDEMGSRDCTSELPFGDYRVGRYGWMTSPVYAEHGPLPVALPEPVPCRGAQGLWTLPADVEAAVMAQRGEGAAR